MSFTAKATLLPAGAAVDGLAVSSRAPVLAGAGGGRIQVYNLVTKQIVAVPVKDRVTGLAVSDDGRFVAYEAGAVASVLDADRQVSLPLDPAGPGKLRFYYDSAGTLGLARQDSPTRLTLYKFDGKSFARAGEHTWGLEPPGVLDPRRAARRPGLRRTRSTSLRWVDSAWDRFQRQGADRLRPQPQGGRRPVDRPAQRRAGGGRRQDGQDRGHGNQHGERLAGDSTPPSATTVRRAAAARSPG